MTMHRCPTCAKPLGDTLTDRMLALLVEKYEVTGQPTTFAYLRDQLGSSDQTTANALRKLKQRGAIEKGTYRGLTGWIVTEQHLMERDTPDYDPALVQRMLQAGRELAGYVGAVQRLPEHAAVEWCGRMGFSEAQAKQIIQSLINMGALQRNDASGDLFPTRA